MPAHKIIIPCCLFLFISACREKKEATPNVMPSPRTIVSIGLASDTIQISEEISLHATASYLLQSDVKANATGYITGTKIKLGDKVNRGAALFSLQTKEARALGNTINKLDASFRFNGNSSVQSPSSGYVIMVNHQTGDYVQDGEVLATVNDASSFGFVMDVPFEYLNLLKNEKSILLSLPDGTHTTGIIAKVMPSADAISQTVKVLVKVANKNIPENLVATVTFVKNKMYGLSVPKAAVVSDETQSSFWVMKLINDSTAVHTGFEKGLENNKWVQVISGNIKTGDRVIVSGNFGLADTSLVTIQNTGP